MDKIGKPAIADKINVKHRKHWWQFWRKKDSVSYMAVGVAAHDIKKGRFGWIQTRGLGKPKGEVANDQHEKL